MIQHELFKYSALRTAPTWLKAINRAKNRNALIIKEIQNTPIYWY